MEERNQEAAALAVGVLCAGLVVAGPALASSQVLAPTDGTYVKECGACHMPFSPELLPADSWRKVMAHLGDHFGDIAKVDPATQKAITDYLVEHSAEKADNRESREVMRSLRGQEAPMRITQVPYIAGLHAAVLDPLWNGHPRPKTLAECGVCHTKASSGEYLWKNFTVNDQAFRGK